MKTVLVLGTARSGTSMISGIVHHLGIDIDMNPEHNPSSQNPKGSFEDQELVRLTSAVRVGDIENHTDLPESVSRMNVYLRQRNSEGKNWGFKSALTHEVWRYIDVSMFEDLHLICNYRSDLMNAKSWLLHLKDNYGDTSKTLEEALQRVQESNATMLQLVRSVDHKRIHTCYEQVKADPLKVASKIANFVGIEFTENLRVRIDEFILRNYSSLNRTDA